MFSKGVIKVVIFSVAGTCDISVVLSVAKEISTAVCLSNAIVRLTVITPG